MSTQAFRDRPASLAAAFAKAAAAHPDRIAVTEGETSLTFDELRAHVNGYAQLLLDRGVTPGDVVSVQLPNWWETHAIMIAASLVGAVLNPIVSIYRQSEVEFIVDQARSVVLVVPQVDRGHDYESMAATIALQVEQHLQVLAVRGALPAPSGPETTQLAELWESTHKHDVEAVAFLLYTSGSTARPKGALHSTRTLVHEALQIAAIARLGSTDAVFMPSPITHVTGLAFGVLLPTLLALPVVLLDRWDPEVALRAVEAHRCTFSVSATTFLLGLTYAYERQGIRSSLRVFICGGAEIGPALVEQAQRSMGTRVVRTYGSTELPTFCTGDPFGDVVAAAASDGTPNPGTDFWLESDQGRVKVGEGEALIRGGELFLGYLDPQATADSFTADGFFRTGDILRVDADGNCRVTGRKKDIIIRGGENLSAIEIEDHLQQHGGVREVAVIAMPDPILGERACAFVVPETAVQPVTLDGMREFLGDRGLAVQKTPERVEFVDSLPRTASGKVQKHLLRDRIRTILQSEAAIGRG